MAVVSRCQTEQDSTKIAFLNKLKAICPDFVVDDANRQVISNIFQWCLRNRNGEYDPMQGLWIYGDVGTGKSTLMKAILEFIRENWLRDSGESINPAWISVPMFCGEYATKGFSVFDEIPVGLDEVGTEYVPTNHVGNKVNVVSQIISTIYDNNYYIPRIVTTNLSMKEVYDKYGSRTFDRIGQIFNIVELAGVSRRKSSKAWNALKAEQSAKSRQ